MLESSYLGLRSLSAFMFSMIIEVGWKSGLILLAWSAIDYFLTWSKLEGDLKMSREELREEFKETDGNPAIKARIRKIQRSMRRTQLLKATETATVVITNPTHYAVALQYDRGMNAPVCLAKGLDAIALKIREVAGEHGIPVVENPPLARALHATVEIDEEIPTEHYRAVAEVIGYVMKLRNAVRR